MDLGVCRLDRRYGMWLMRRIHESLFPACVQVPGEQDLPPADLILDELSAIEHVSFDLAATDQLFAENGNRAYCTCSLLLLR